MANITSQEVLFHRPCITISEGACIALTECIRPVGGGLLDRLLRRRLGAGVFNDAVSGGLSPIVLGWRFERDSVPEARAIDSIVTAYTDLDSGYIVLQPGRLSFPSGSRNS
jgi:hypothetical protein